MSYKVIHNALIVNENSHFHGYIVINGELIETVGHGEAPAEILSSCNCIEDACGAYLIPGVIDSHVHFRDPGLIHKADMETESHTAVAGGVTSFMDMPNTIPPTTTVEAIEAKQERAAKVSVANYAFFIGATNNNIDTLLSCDYTKVPGVKIFLGSSTGNMLVNKGESLKRIFSEVKAPIAIHSEDEQIIRHNREAMIKRYGNNIPIEMHPLIRSKEACVQSTKYAVEMAKRYGTRLHLLHISTADELCFLDNSPIEDKKITAEVCVHYLWWCDKDYVSLGSQIKCNPAIKTATDRTALRNALNSGLIDIVSTDHAPHLLEEKRGDAIKAASGIPMLGFSLPLMLELADQGIFTVETVVDKMAHAPAKLYGIDRRGFIRKGYFADLVVINPTSPYTITNSMMTSRCGWTPLAGTTLNNKVISTYVNGNRVYHDGIVDNSIHGKALKFDIDIF